MSPTISKSALVTGRNLLFRNANVDDARFIFSLRTNPERSQFLSKVSSRLEDQVAWLTNYADKDNEAYFIIESQTGEKLGTVRLYDAQGVSFCWGSWIIIDGAPSSTGIESALMVYAYAIDHLGFTNAHFEVRKENEGVWKFHERFGAQRIGETFDHYQYTLASEEISRSRLRYRKYLPDGVIVTP